MRIENIARPQQHNQANLWHTVNHILAIAIIFGGLIAVGFHFVPIWGRTRELEDLIRQRQRELQRALLLQKKQEREIFLLQSDPIYLETIARDKLDLMKPGETIFRIGNK